MSPAHIPQYVFKLPFVIFKIPAVSYNPFLLVKEALLKLIRAILSSLLELVSLLFLMPSVFTRLWMAHFCSWMGLMSVILYYTEFFGEIMYGGDPGAEKGSVQRQNYEAGLRMGSFGLFCQNVVAMLCSFFIDNVIQRFGRRNVYLFSTVFFVSSIT